jgi:hypothetical protein
VSHLVEFDTSDRYFEWRQIQLIQWLEKAGREYNARNEPITLQIDQADDPQPVIIRANDYMLETVFWNL